MNVTERLHDPDWLDHCRASVAQDHFVAGNVHDCVCSQNRTNSICRYSRTFLARLVTNAPIMAIHANVLP